jgi:hypothetical protein
MADPGSDHEQNASSSNGPAVDTDLTTDGATSFLRINLLYLYLCYIMATIFSSGRSQSTRREPPIIGKQLVNFITCGCESSAPFLDS